ncbi:MAG: tRNA (adenosine(37)-N6)-threonylcarbamoyltransferase complex ATPase subunit type 1 TsaE, partial [Patescibacteria group bacterium]
MQKYTVKNLTATKKLATKIARQIRNGGVIGLIGNLGAGKTTFTQLLAQVIGVKQVVNSPTFNIIKVYKIKNQKSKIKNLVHIDAYRLHSPEELTALGVEEYFNDAQTVTIIEWADKVKKILP